MGLKIGEKDSYGRTWTKKRAAHMKRMHKARSNGSSRTRKAKAKKNPYEVLGITGSEIIKALHSFIRLTVQQEIRSLLGGS